jgi:hypothetical protein
VPRASATQQQIRVIRRSVAAIERALKRLGAMLRGGGGATGEPRRLKLSPKRRAELKLHGRYLGHMRQLKPRQKARVRAVKQRNGYHAAIALAKRLAPGQRQRSR